MFLQIKTIDLIVELIPNVIVIIFEARFSFTLLRVKNYYLCFLDLSCTSPTRVTEQVFFILCIKFLSQILQLLILHFNSRILHFINPYPTLPVIFSSIKCWHKPFCWDKGKILVLRALIRIESYAELNLTIYLK